MRAFERAVSAAVLGSVLISATACSAAAPQDGDWVLTPIRYDNTMDGEPAAGDFIDAAYPMEVVSDTAGGFWGVSSLSWLHVDGSGNAVRRFNLDPLPAHGTIAAVDTTRLVSVTTDPFGASNLLQIFDTETMSWEVLHSDDRNLGDVAVSGSKVFFVAFDDMAGTFTVARLPLDTDDGPVDVARPLPAVGDVAIDVGDDGRIYAATTVGGYIFAPGGELLTEVSAASSDPAVSVNGRDEVLWAHEGPPQALPAFIEGGSAAAREVIDRHIECDTSVTGGGPVDFIALMDAEASVTMPFLCAPAGMTWLTDEEFIVSVGNEGGAPLVRVVPPND